MPQHLVLLVDDNPDAVEGLRLVLELGGYAVEAAYTGRDALTYLHNGLRPCVIIMDIMMPVMNGFEFRAEQLKSPDLATIPLIACSGVVDVSREVRDLNADAYLTKTAPSEDVLALVRRFCDPTAPHPH